MSESEELVYLREEVVKLREQNAQQLAACDVAAMSDTEETHASAICPRESPFWSPAYESVMRRTSECLKLREENRKLKSGRFVDPILSPKS